MHAKKVSHKILDNACAWMHAHCRNALIVGVLAAIDDRRQNNLGQTTNTGRPSKTE